MSSSPLPCQPGVVPNDFPFPHTARLIIFQSLLILYNIHRDFMTQIDVDEKWK